MNWKQIIFIMLISTIGYLLFVSFEASLNKVDFLTSLIMCSIALGFVGLLALVMLGCHTVLEYLGDK